MNEHPHGTDDPGWTPRQRRRPDMLRRRGFRLILTAAIGTPVLLVFGMAAALSSGFCGDRLSSEVQNCEDSASTAGWVVFLLLLLMVALFVTGVVLRTQARLASPTPSERHARSTPLPRGAESMKATAAVVLAGMCVVCTMTIALDDGDGWGLLSGLALLLLVPTAFVVAWGADSTRRHELDGRHSPRAVAAALATVLCIVVLLTM